MQPSGQNRKEKRGCLWFRGCFFFSARRVPVEFSECIFCINRKGGGTHWRNRAASNACNSSSRSEHRFSFTHTGMERDRLKEGQDGAWLDGTHLNTNAVRLQSLTDSGAGGGCVDEGLLSGAAAASVGCAPIPKKNEMKQQPLGTQPSSQRKGLEGEGVVTDTIGRILPQRKKPSRHHNTRRQEGGRRGE